MSQYSVLLSVYFKENPTYLRQSLESVFQQTLPPDEVVLVEDGALTDELYNVIQYFKTNYLKQLRIIKLAQNGGLGNALREGLLYCSNELVARMDTDDIAKSDRFEKQVRLFENLPDIDVCSAWIDEFEGNILNIISTRKLPEHHDELYNFAKSRCPVSHPVVMFKKSAVLAAGGYQHFPLFEDYHLWIRMMLNGARFYNIQESLLYFRFSPNMFERRGGLKYAKDEFRLLNFMHQRHFISDSQFIKNVIIRFITRIMPNMLRSFIYKKVIRKFY